MKSLIILSAFLVIAVATSSCTSDNKSHDHSTEENSQKYTCPMHPQIIESAPGTCPVCKMDLVPVKALASNEIMLTDSQVKLANIRTAKVAEAFVGHSHFANGRLMVDETRSEKISARINGRIDKLYIKETGTAVRRGDPVFELFSEQLLTLQQEYLLALEQFEALGGTKDRYQEILRSAEKKLVLYGMSGGQIEALRNSRKVKEWITYFSPVSGYVADVQVSEGQYVQEGMTLFEVQDNTRLWVEAELYANETALLKVGDSIKVRVTGFEASAQDAKVSFFSPEFRANTQINMMRAEMKNPEGKFKPGMQAQVLFTSSGRKAMAVPLDAVIRDASGSHVYVKTGENTFEPRMIRTGNENVEVTEVTEGLNGGEEVVTSGAYLLYSEIVLKKGAGALHDHH